jgi:putative component of membrane protein insertase Oxa1/YidC/SpoIIIJ protein YidD
MSALIIYLILIFSCNVYSNELFPNFRKVINKQESNDEAFLPFDYKYEKKDNSDCCNKRKVTKSSLLDLYFYLWKNYLTHVDGPRCPHYPTCSQFAYASIKKFGLKGFALTTNRLFSEYGNINTNGFYNIYFLYGEGRIFDPVESYENLETIKIYKP